MPTTPMYRVETTITGVAGSPYYIVGYFDSEAGSPDAAIGAWHTFITGSTTGTAAGFPTDATIRTSNLVPVIDPVDGGTLSVAIGDVISQAGANTGPRTPPATQMLMRWRTGVYANRREIRGRTNLPCVMEEASTAMGVVEPSVVTGLNGRAADLLADADAVHVVWSKKNGVWADTTAGGLWDQFSVLRSRRD